MPCTAIRPTLRLMSVIMLRPLSLLVYLFATLFAFAAPSLAQSSLSAAVLSAQPLSSQDQQTISAYVDSYVRNIESGDAASAQAARDRLVDPALSETSVGFRLYFSQQVMPTIQRIVGQNPDAQQMQIVMSIAGAIATDPARTILVDAIQDPRAAVRFGAAREFGTLLNQIDKGQGFSAINQGAVDPLVGSLGDWLASEPNILIAAEISKALGTPSQTRDLKVRSLTAMCNAMATQAQRRLANAANNANVFEEIVAMLRVVGEVQPKLIQLQIEGGAPAPLNEAASRFAQVAVRFADEASKNSALNADGRTLATQLATAASNLRDLANP